MEKEPIEVAAPRLTKPLDPMAQMNKALKPHEPMSKRETFAIMAFQGLLSDRGNMADIDGLLIAAVKCADKLIDYLDHT